MEITSKGTGIVSFSDESSPHTATTGREKVCICATVVAEAPFEWFYELRSHFPHLPELKGSTVVPALQTLGEPVRSRVLNGLRSVQIHITDPRPYRADLNRVWIEVAGASFPAEELMSRARKGDPHAQMVLRSADEFIGRSVLLDSPYYRLRRHVYTSSPLTPLGDASTGEPLAKAVELDLSELRATKGRKSLRATIAEYAAKSAPVFVIAGDRATNSWLRAATATRTHLASGWRLRSAGWTMRTSCWPT